MTEQIDLQVERLLFVIRRATQAGWKMIPHSNKNYVLVYAKSGKAHYSIGTNRYLVSADDVLLIPQGQLYSAMTDEIDPWCYYTVGLHLSFADAHSQQVFDQLPLVIPVGHIPQIKSYFVQLHHIWNTESPLMHLKCRSLVMEIIYTLLYNAAHTQVQGTQCQKLDPLIAMLRNNNKKNYSLDELASRANMSVSLFRKQFKQRTGMSIVQYQNHAKIEKAKELLLSQSYNVSEAAREVGIEDVYYFSRLFRKMTGVPPSFYLK